MTLHRLKRFSVPASAGTKETCAAAGHAFADRKGRCLRCGAQIRASGFNEKAEHEAETHAPDPAA